MDFAKLGFDNVWYSPVNIGQHPAKVVLSKVGPGNTEQVLIRYLWLAT
jgi:hypothetical protein